MSFISFFIAGALAFWASRYAAGLWLRRGQPVEACLNLGCAAFMLTFAVLFLALPSHWSWPQPSPSKAFTSTLQLAEQGDAKAGYRVGMMYNLGEEVPRDKTQAVYWTKKSAEQGDAEAQVAFGGMYLSGDYQAQGIAKDYRQGKEWIRKAADQGYVWAKMILYNMEYEEKSQGLK